MQIICKKFCRKFTLFFNQKTAENLTIFEKVITRKGKFKNRHCERME